MSDTGNIPQAMIEAAAKVLADQTGRLFDLTDRYARVVLEEHRDLAFAVLAAAFAECEVNEEFGHSHSAKVSGLQWHAHVCPTTTRRRLVITTPPVVVSPAQEETAND